MIKWHENNIGWHFYLPINPIQLASLDMWIARINLFWPFYVSLSFGLLGHKGLQIGGGIKYDPTETLKLGENDYLFSAHFRIHKLGQNFRISSEASF